MPIGLVHAHGYELDLHWRLDTGIPSGGVLTTTAARLSSPLAWIFVTEKPDLGGT